MTLPQIEWIHRQLKKALDFLGEIDTELKEGKDVKAFAKFLGFTILIMFIVTAIILGLGSFLVATNSVFMKVIAGIIIILFLLVIICVLWFLRKKFLKKP